MQRAELTRGGVDAGTVARAQAGEMEAFAELYEAYFPAVYDFLVRLLRDPDEAADVTQDAFLKAMRALASLREPAHFRAWLFSIARNAALNRLEARKRLAPLEPPGEQGASPAFAVVDERRFADPAEVAAAAEAAALIEEAARALDPRQLSLLDLHVRQGLDTAEVAAVLGVTRNNAAVMLHRLREAVRRALEAAALAKRPACARLAAAVADLEGPLTPEVRRIVEKHADRCPECDERRKKVAPLLVYGALAPVPPPPGLRERLLATLRDAAEAGELASEPASPEEAELPLLLSSHRLLASAALAAAALFAAILAFVPGSPVSVFRTGLFDEPPRLPAVLPFPPLAERDSTTPTPTATPTKPPAASPTAATTAPPGARGGAAPSQTPRPTPARPTPSPSPSPSPSPTAPPTATATPTPPACTPVVRTNVPFVAVAPPSWTTTVRLYDSFFCGTPFTAAADSEGGWLTASPGEGRLEGPNFTAELTLAVDPGRLPGTGEGFFRGSVRIAWGSESIALAVEARSIGGEPRVERVETRCLPDGTLQVAVAAFDDFGVLSGTVTLGETSADLVPQENGTWTAVLSRPDGTTDLSGLVTVVDGAGQAGTRVFTVVCE